MFGSKQRRLTLQFTYSVSYQYCNDRRARESNIQHKDMDTSNKNTPKSNNSTPNTSYNPWNLIFNTRNRTDSENSVNSNTPRCQQSESQFRELQRQTSKNEEYLWMMWRS